MKFTINLRSHFFPMFPSISSGLGPKLRDALKSYLLTLDAYVDSPAEFIGLWGLFFSYVDTRSVLF